MTFLESVHILNMCYFLFTFLNGSENVVNYHLLFNNILNKFLHLLQICSTLHVNVLSLKQAVLGMKIQQVVWMGIESYLFKRQGGPLQAMGVPVQNPEGLHRNSTHFKPFLGYFLGF